MDNQTSDVIILYSFVGYCIQSFILIVDYRISVMKAQNQNPKNVLKLKEKVMIQRKMKRAMDIEEDLNLNENSNATTGKFSHSTQKVAFY